MAGQRRALERDRFRGAIGTRPQPRHEEARVEGIARARGVLGIDRTRGNLEPQAPAGLRMLNWSIGSRAGPWKTC